MPDMYETYKENIMPKLTEKRGYTNRMMVPRISKILISTGIGSDSERDAFAEAKKNHDISKSSFLRTCPIPPLVVLEMSAERTSSSAMSTSLALTWWTKK